LNFSTIFFFTEEVFLVSFFTFLGWGETESTWYVGYCLVYCTSSR
jgi:hypothetical protein